MEKKKERKEIYDKAIRKWGGLSQFNKVIEETGEFLQALSELTDDKDHLAEEIADLSIMLEQVEHICDIEEDVEQYKEFKINRLKDRVNEEA